MDDMVRIKAFELWEAEGHPVGRDEDHWFRAKQMVVAPSDEQGPPQTPKADAAVPPVAEKAGAVKAQRLRGAVDGAALKGLFGWVRDEAHPTDRLTVLLFDNEKEIARTTASLYRGDLEKAGIGDGRFGYNIAVPPDFWRAGPHSVRMATVEGHPIPDSRSRLAMFTAELLALT